MNPNAPLSVTFPDDHDATAQIIATHPMASQIVERYADSRTERPDDLAAAVAGWTVTATAAELGLVGACGDLTVDVELTVSAGGKKDGV